MSTGRAGVEDATPRPLSHSPSSMCYIACAWVHLLRNLKLRYKRIVDIVFHACDKTYNVVDFEHEMRQYLEFDASGICQELE